MSSHTYGISVVAASSQQQHLHSLFELWGLLYVFRLSKREEFWYFFHQLMSHMCLHG